MKINEIIKEKRLALGYTQEQLAKFLNLTTPAVNKWERGISYPDITILPALARILILSLLVDGFIPISQLVNRNDMDHLIVAF